MKKNNELHLNSETTIGFLGDGQLARMSALCAMEMGFKTAFFAESNTSPCSALGLNIVAKRDDRAALLELAGRVNVLTLENEFVNPVLLQDVAKVASKMIFPSPDSFAQIQSKVLQKHLFKRFDLSVANFARIESSFDAENFGKEFGYPFLLKSEFGGYDGYGNAKIAAVSDISGAFAKLKGPLYAESFVPFVREVSLIAVRTDSEIVFYPLSETVQENHICRWVFAKKSGADTAAALLLQKQVEKLLSDIEYVGVFALELFELSDGAFVANECAPRPHNSGHWTQDGAFASQFENHVRAVVGLRLGSTAMTAQFAGMYNFLGVNASAPFEMDFVRAYGKIPNTALHFYGKHQSKPGRKLGHINFWADTETEFNEIRNQIAKVKL